MYFSVFSENLGRLVYSAFLLSMGGLVMSESMMSYPLGTTPRALYILHSNNKC